MKAKREAQNAEKIAYPGFDFSGFDYGQAALLLRQASPHKESLAKIEQALRKASYERGEKLGIPKDKAAWWILGRTLRYFELKAEARKADVKRAVDFISGSHYEDEQTGDRSSGNNHAMSAVSTLVSTFEKDARVVTEANPGRSCDGKNCRPDFKNVDHRMIQPIVKSQSLVGKSLVGFGRNRRKVQ